MALRFISLVLLGLALSSCSYGGIADRSRQYSGVWLYEFEGSTFVEGATEIPAQRPAYEETDWLEWRTDWPQLEALMDKDSGPERCNPVQPFLVTFVGRRIRRLGGAGHLGLWRSEMEVQRPISAKRLGASFCYDRW